MIDQIKAFDRLFEALNDRCLGEDISTRDFIEAMDIAGLVLVHGSQDETLTALDKMDEEAS